MNNACQKPVFLPEFPLITMRCRKCLPCVKHRQMEWVNRMTLELQGRDYMPMMVSCDIAPKNYLDSPKYVLQKTQKMFRSIRRRGHDIRYFMAIERGEKRGRLHNHMIVYSDSMNRLPYYDRWKILHDSWKLGFVKMEPLRGIGGLVYTAKYLLKDLGEHVDRKTGEIKQCRNYTWSNKPRLGDPGLTRWEYVIEKSHENQPYSLTNLPINHINIVVMGKIHKAWIPSKTYVNKCKDLGIDIAKMYKKEDHKEIDIDQTLENHDIWLDAVDQDELEIIRSPQFVR